MSETVYDPATFWEDRHRRLSRLRSGGHASMSEADNERFYFRRLALLVDIIGDVGSARVPARVLDAGCGRGWFVGRLRELGYDVEGFDTSPTALESARQLVPDAVLTQAAIDRFTTLRTYDVVYCVDVLFHLLDDHLWERSVRRLATLTSATGTLVVADAGFDEVRALGGYIRYRPRSWYDRVLAPHGFTHRSWVPYGFRDSVVGFHVYEAASSGGVQ